MKCAHSSLSAQLFERGRLIQAAFDVAAQSANEFYLSISRGRVSRPAAPTRTKARLFSGVWSLKESNLGAAGSSSGTRRSAIDPSRTNGEVDLPIETGVSFSDRPPDRVFIKRLRMCRPFF